MAEFNAGLGNDMISTFDEVFESFDAMGLHENLLKGIHAYGFERPSPIQQRGIVPFTRGLDVIEVAKSGTGKTATLCSGVLQQIDISLLECQGLVLAPTRELAQEIEKVMHALGVYLQVKVHACVGGESAKEDERILQAGVHIAVGTPGLVYDMLRSHSLRPDNVKMFVLDEADDLLARGFKDQICATFHLLPPKLQVGAFSATFPPETLEFTRKFMNKPVKVSAREFEELALLMLGVKNFYVDVEKEEWKLDTLCDIYETLPVTQSVVFVKTTPRVGWLTDKMKSKGYTVSATHEDMDQGTRDVIMRKFRSESTLGPDDPLFGPSTHVLITTDLNRGRDDIPWLSLTINYDLPTRPETYLHRMGHTSRFGRKKVAINLVTHDDERMFQDIQRFYCTTIRELPSDVSNLL